MAGRHDLVIVANRLPVHHDAGDSPWEPSPGGLVRAMLGVVRQRHGAWVGWSGLADDGAQPFQHDDIPLIPVALSADEVAEFYDGFSNDTLWPLYHDAIRTPRFEQDWWEAYVTVNQRFADAAAGAAAPGGTVWVHDYQLQLVPGLLRERRPDLRIGFFLHIPFPPQELFMRLPWREEILRGILGADVVGLQRRGAVENLAACSRRLLDAQGAVQGLVVDGRRVEIGSFPISIDVAEFEELASRPHTQAHAVRLRARLGDPDVVLLGIDRLDYTKGIDVRLEAFRDLLANGELDRRRCTLVQVAIPTRERIEHYADERRRVEQLVGEINGEFSRLGYPVVHYLHQNVSMEELSALYQVGDVMLVTPLRDGMNLVAKEYAASRVDGGGVLVLSEFAGAADELSEALLVNPHDREAVQRAMVDAASMDPEEARRRMAAIRKVVTGHDVSHWAQGFLSRLEPSLAA
ncbi:MAG TPA: trehalose-6-phosphate synthase [Acidimicrobiales bacterium]